jgi:hypothetical protein
MMKIFGFVASAFLFSPSLFADTYTFSCETVSSLYKGKVEITEEGCSGDVGVYSLSSSNFIREFCPKEDLEIKQVKHGFIASCWGFEGATKLNVNFHGASSLEVPIGGSRPQKIDLSCVDTTEQ